MSWRVVIIVGMVHSITFSFPSLNNRTKKGMFSEKTSICGGPLPKQCSKVDLGLEDLYLSASCE